MNGKGSLQRPVDKKKFDENYDRIFRKKEKNMKLTNSQKHVMELIDKGMDPETGWASVSEALYSNFSNVLPKELALFEKLDNGGRAKLTDEGRTVLDVMHKWLD